MSGTSNQPGSLRNRLSVREEQIVKLLLRGRTNSEIALELSLRAKTIKGYMTTLMAKLNVRNRLEVVLAAQNLNPTANRVPETDEHALQRQCCALLMEQNAGSIRHPKGWWAFQLASDPKHSRADFADLLRRKGV
ncbi:response regulator transcription factor [Bosea sp. 2RAB26]|uniref:response regulator transcription factor n=1 Tax=Bosea sp. 2RAB26 TaxID=3237476 RepID=UPI003F8FA5B7